MDQTQYTTKFNVFFFCCFQFDYASILLAIRYCCCQFWSQSQNVFTIFLKWFWRWSELSARFAILFGRIAMIHTHQIWNNRKMRNYLQFFVFCHKVKLMESFPKHFIGSFPHCKMKFTWCFIKLNVFWFVCLEQTTN